MTWKLTRFSANPGASWPGGSRAGTNVLRAGRSTAARDDCTATRAYSSQSRSRPANAWTVNAADTKARQVLVTTTSLRRSIASTTGPHSSPTVRVGTICATPIAPTASEERVRS
jgi:hypothetical protein